jgi:Rhs element Vgr protein
MLAPFDITQELLKYQLSSSNNYTLQLDSVTSPQSAHTVTGLEVLNKSCHYEIIFTSSHKQISPNSILAQKAQFTFQPPPTTHFSKKQSSLTQPALPRTLYGVITEFNQLSINKQEARYKVVLAPRLTLLELHNYSAIYQNQSVIAVVEQILRKHGFTSINYRLELHNSYPMREFITQWQESDLAFIQRILADIGVWFRFETDSKQGCQVLVISDSEQGYHNHGTIVYKHPNGTPDNGTDSIRDLQQHSKAVPQPVPVQDYNYRESNSDMQQAEVNSQPGDSTTHGTQHLYNQHFTLSADKEIVLMCRGAYIRIISERTELGTQDNVQLKGNIRQKMGPASPTKAIQLKIK